MKLSQLLSQRSHLLRQMRLANLAFAYASLRDFARRIRRARLAGVVTLQPVNPDEERYCATLTAHDGRQSLIEEHFTDEDLTTLADAVAQVSGHPTHEHTFHLESLEQEFAAPLRAELERAGVQFDQLGEPVEETQR